MQPLRLLLALLACAMAMPLAPVAAAGRLACAVCEAIVDEVNSGIAATRVQHSVQTRFRIDEKKRIPYARTEHNLLEIMEGDAFLRKFEAYAVVAPSSDSHAHLRRAYQAALEGKEPEPVVKRVQKENKQAEAPKEEPVQVEEPAKAEQGAETAAADAPATLAEGEQAAATPEAAAAVDSTATPPAAEAEKEEAAQEGEEEEEEMETKTYPPYRAKGPEPLSLSLSQHTLVLQHEAVQAGLETEQGSRVQSEIRAAVAAFLDDNLDEAMLMFHRDVPELKRKLCVQATESCVARKEKKKKKGKKRKGKKSPPKKKPEPKKEEQEEKKEEVPVQPQEAQPTEVKPKEEL